MTIDIHSHLLNLSFQLLLTSNAPNKIAKTNVRFANINRLPPNAPNDSGVILCTLPEQQA